MNLLAGHLFGDFLLQNDWLARTKIQSIFSMILHCLLYTFGIWLFSHWEINKLAIVFITHFIIDYFGIGKKIYPNLINPKNKSLPMWLNLVYDQSFHIIVLGILK